MQSLKQKLESIAQSQQGLPFSVYSSVTDQHLLNVPIVKPLLICILGGEKRLGDHAQPNSSDTVCAVGDFIFLSNMPNINMRNISQKTEYFALLIGFEFEDFAIFNKRPAQTKPFFTGKLDNLLVQTLDQFVDWSPSAPETLWHTRRQELLLLLYHMGHKQVSAIAEPPSLSHKVEILIGSNIELDSSSESIAKQLAMSDSTLRRKLALENTHFQTLKDRVKLGHGLHLLQTSGLPIGLVAEQCGYQSQSRFTDKFKSLFGLTPSELRKTKLHEKGE
ncbi:MAG: helix-turn-helix domain-containing protein [Alteromonadaceae bacterium]|nr:helix-turn-helix domain-containing protein [Alteromonadaceae bacterium]